MPFVSSYRFTRLKHHLTDLVFPPACVGCGTLLDPFDDRRPIFCPICTTKSECSRIRGEVLLEAPCRLAHISLYTYRPGEAEGVPEKLIYHLKHRDERRVFDHVAQLLSREIAALWERLGITAEDVVWTYPPRRSAAIRKDGFDQAKRLTNALAKVCGGDCLPVIKRIGHRIKEQKKLTARERRRNAAKAYALNPHVEELVKGRMIMLVDDVCTTGSTLSACADLLMEAGADAVVWITVARV